jgi:hypothetical protein
MSDTFMRRFFEWFSQAETIRTSQERVAAKSDHRAKLEQHARIAAEAGDALLHPVAPLRSGSGKAVSSLLHKESISTTLLALGRAPNDLVEDDALRSEVTRALPASVSFERLSELVAAPPQIDAVETKIGIRSEEAEALAGAAHALLDVALAPEHQLQRALTRRLLRISVTALLLALATVVVVEAVISIAIGPNLASGKPWRASSAYAGFSPEAGMCDGRKTRIFFHTNREQDPWVELDLGEPTLIHRVDVRNRRDCCRDRSFPLMIEGSLDGQTWHELGRQTQPFTKWTLEFEPTRARYVRAKALKRTFLHLESFEVR